LTDLKPGNPYPLEGLVLHGWPWGVEPQPLPSARRPQLAGALHVALVHKYVWAPGHGYPGAPESARLRSVRRLFEGYDVVLVGDNHRGFYSNDGPCKVFNGGGLRRDHSDQADYRPRVGLVRADGRVTPHYLDVSRDRTAAVTRAAKAERDASPALGELVEELTRLGDRPFDFAQALFEHCASADVRAAVVAALRRAVGEGE
jgi:hypothetical protein